MVYRHLGHIQDLGHEPFYLAGMLAAAMTTPLYFWNSHLKRFPPARAMRLQTLAAETAFYGSLGVHIDRVSCLHGIPATGIPAAFLRGREKGNYFPFSIYPTLDKGVLIWYHHIRHIS
jgi:hypothetical protein